MSSVLESPKRSERSPTVARRPRWKVSLGDLIAAAFEVAKGDEREAKALLSSRELSKALKKRIVLV
jgi:hypothetical protein